MFPLTTERTKTAVDQVGRTDRQMTYFLSSRASWLRMNFRTKSFSGFWMISAGRPYWAMVPWSMMSTRSERVRASSGSWVTMMVVRWYSRAMVLIRSLMDSLITPSRADRGSSSRRIRGFITMVRAAGELVHPLV